MPENPIADLRTQKQRMLDGDLYTVFNDELLLREGRDMQARLLEYNAAPPENRYALLQSFLGTCGKDVTIRTPFACDYGYNIHIATTRS